MSTQLVSITLHTPNPNQILEFYSKLGFEFKAKKISLGGEYFAAQVGAIRLSIYPKLEMQTSFIPNLQLGFVVADLQQVYSNIVTVTGAIVLMEPTAMPTGMMAVLSDPDGNSIELVQD